MSWLQDLLDLPKMVLPYAFHPLAAVKVFLPHTRLVAWLTEQNDFDLQTDIPSLHEKVILVTGGNAGLGLETIYQLAQKCPEKIILAARSAEKARAAIQQIEERFSRDDKTNTSRIVWLKLDLSDLASVREAANEVLSNTRRLDVLVLNAGVMATPPSKTKAGHDLQLGINHLGHFLLTRLLLPLLEETVAGPGNPKVGVITLSSEAYHIAPADFLQLIEDHDRLCSSSSYTRYGVSKAANILFASEIARRYGDKNVQSVSLHPGIILTDLYAHTKDANLFIRYGLPQIARFVFDDTMHGALNTLWCIGGALSGKAKNGSYYTPVGKLKDIDLTEDTHNARRLWEWSEQQVKQFD